MGAPTFAELYGHPAPQQFQRLRHGLHFQVWYGRLLGLQAWKDAFRLEPPSGHDECQSQPFASHLDGCDAQRCRVLSLPKVAFVVVCTASGSEFCLLSKRACGIFTVVACLIMRERIWFYEFGTCGWAGDVDDPSKHCDGVFCVFIAQMVQMSVVP